MRVSCKPPLIPNSLRSDLISMPVGLLAWSRSTFEPGGPRGLVPRDSPVVRLTVLGSPVRSLMRMLRRYDVTVGTTGIARVVQPLNLVLNVLPVPCDILPGLNRTSASLVSLFVRQSRRGGAEDAGGCEGNFGLGQHGRVSFAGVKPIDRTVRSRHIWRWEAAGQC